jgi:hypothetical protein
LQTATGCKIDESFGRGIDPVRFVFAAIGPSGVRLAQEPTEKSFTCNLVPRGTQQFVAAQFDTAADTAAAVSWLLSTKKKCRPIATVGDWVLASVRAPTEPQVSDEFESAVAELGGTVAITCR